MGAGSQADRYAGEFTLGHDTKGMAVTDTIYDDADIEQMKNISEEAPHRKITLNYIKADTEGKHSLKAILRITATYAASADSFRMG